MGAVRDRPEPPEGRWVILERLKLILEFVLSLVVLVFVFALVIAAAVLHASVDPNLLAGAWALAAMVLGAWIKGQVPGMGTPAGPPTTTAPPVAPPAP